MLTRACRVQSLKGVSGDVIILEEAAYCDPGLVSEVYAKQKAPSAIAHSSRAASVRAQSRAALKHAAVRPALHQYNSRQRQPCALPQTATATPGSRVPRLRCADYSKMMEMVDDYGHPIFESIKITLVRATCTHK